MTTTEKLIYNFIKAHGVEEENTPKVYLSSDNNAYRFKYDALNMGASDYDILYMGIYECCGAKNGTYDECVQFLGIQLDEDGEDTTSEMFFDFDELSHEVQYNILKLVNGLENANSADVARFIADGINPSENEEKVYYWQVVANNSKPIESDEGFESADDAFRNMRNEVYCAYMTQTPNNVTQQILINSDNIIYRRGNETFIFKVISYPKYETFSVKVKVNRYDIDAVKVDISHYLSNHDEVADFNL